MTAREAALREELAAVRDTINAAYWAFTRTARGKPPSTTVPHAYDRQREILQELKETRNDR